MTIEERITALERLGFFLGQFSRSAVEKNRDIPSNDPHFDNLLEKVDQAVHHNGWFTRDNIIYSLEQWSNSLDRTNLEKWLSSYSLEHVTPRTVGIVMAGNIPLVGFHDLLCVLISGHSALVRQSTNDQLLLPAIVAYLQEVAPEWHSKIRFLDPAAGGASRMSGYDAIIATGSNNTARYFEYYFRNKPSIIRKNRHSVAVLTGDERPEDLAALGEDIFRYYGLGCRNVSKIYVPEGYDFDSFFEAIYPWHTLMDQAKYANNYDYNKAVYLMSRFELLENGFLLLKKDESLGSPIATLFYEDYKSFSKVRERILELDEQIQCVVSTGLFQDEVAFGRTQQPQLWDYPDRIDTISFLTEKI